MPLRSPVPEPRAARSTVVRERGGARSAITAAVALVAVAAVAALFAYAFRETSLGVLHVVAGHDDPTVAARSGATLAVAAVVAAAVVTSAWLAHRVAARQAHDVGLTALAAEASGRGSEPSLAATAVRSSGTWLASASMVSVGRESAILETSGLLGSLAGRRVGHRAALTGAGVAAAFAAAYHAPIAGVLYVAEHLGLRRDRWALGSSVAAVALAHLLSVSLLHGEEVFPGRERSYAGLLVPSLVALIPAALGARVFLELRDRATPAARVRRMPWSRVVPPALVVAATVALVPLTAGNGMEALRSASTDTTAGIAMSLAIAKLVATAAALRAGTPGGSFSPTLAVSAGWALLALLGAEALGLPIAGARWDGMLVAMAVGVAVGLQAPLTAMVVVPEMSGDLTLVPVCAVAVAAAWLFDRRVAATIERRRARPLRDDDA